MEKRNYIQKCVNYNKFNKILLAAKKQIKKSDVFESTELINTINEVCILASDFYKANFITKMMYRKIEKKAYRICKNARRYDHAIN